MATDPTYPLFPVIALSSATLLLLLLATNFVRHSWNLGIAFLAFWLFWENLFAAISSIIWSDNADIKLYVYCDIVSHLNLFAYIVKPACTLILTRRLYKIASLRSLAPESRRARVVNAIIEWSLGLGLPALVVGVFYYIVQGARFEVMEGYGCDNTENFSGVQILLIDTPALILPLISALFYCPKIIYVFYRQSRDTNEFLRTNGSVSRDRYFRILFLGCLDIFITLPFGIMQLVARIKPVARIRFPWYWGWDVTHSNWGPVSFSWSDIEGGGFWGIFSFYFGRWSSAILALAIFALFGFTAESRATYTRVMHVILKLFGWTPPKRKHDNMGEVQFGIRSLVSSRARTQQSAFAAFPEMREFEAGEDPEQGVQRSLISDSGEIKAIGAVVDSGSRNIKTATILQVEDGDSSGNGTRSNTKDGGIHLERASYDFEKLNIDGRHFEGPHEDSSGTQPARLRSSVEVAESA